MKQQYIKPEISAVLIDCSQIICSSNLEYGGDGNGTPAQARPLDFDPVSFDGISNLLDD